MIEGGADVNVKNTYGVTSLMMASPNGHPETVKLLLDSKANVNTATPEGHTPLYIAKMQGHSEIVKLLKEYGAK